MSSKKDMRNKIVKANPPFQCLIKGYEIWSQIEKKILTTTSSKSSENILHHGGCHCGSIRFSCEAPKDLILWDCNCSDCRLRRNIHFIIPRNQMKSIQKGELKEYKWGTGKAIHYFCIVCGISPFYIPRSNPDGYAITFAALDEGTVDSIEIKRFDGRNWENFITSSPIGKSICDLSKT